MCSALLTKSRGPLACEEHWLFDLETLSRISKSLSQSPLQTPRNTFEQGPLLLARNSNLIIIIIFFFIIRLLLICTFYLLLIMVLSWDCQPTWSAFIYSPPPPSPLSLFRTHCKYFSDKPPWPATPLFESPYLSVKNQSVGIEKSRYPDGNHSLVWNDQVCPILRWNVFFETCQTVSFRKMCCVVEPTVLVQKALVIY